MQAPSSPDVVWPIVLPFIGSPKTAVDFGCGTGHWLVGLKRQLPDIEILGLNSERRGDAGKFLQPDQFRTADLTKPVDLGRKFDLATCIEVAEHLPVTAADTLIDTITRHSDVVYFSAAIPGQGGEDHFNEQWPDYWIKRFADRGFACFDCLRPIVWHNDGVSLWYRQNIMLFMKSPRKPLIKAADWRGEALVHPLYFELAAGRKRRSLSNLARFVIGEPLR